MSLIAAGIRYVRAPATLWRDTGLHVVVLSSQGGDASVLGGGGALLWRLLDEPLALDEIEQRLGAVDAAPHDAEAVLSCLEDLVDRGLVAWLIEEDEL